MAKELHVSACSTWQYLNVPWNICSQTTKAEVGELLMLVEPIQHLHTYLPVRPLSVYTHLDGNRWPEISENYWDDQVPSFPLLMSFFRGGGKIKVAVDTEE